MSCDKRLGAEPWLGSLAALFIAVALRIEPQPHPEAEL